MNKIIKFDSNFIILLIILILTLVLWIGFELYRQQNNVEIDQTIMEYSEKKLPENYDKEFITNHYKLKDKYYEIKD